MYFNGKYFSYFSGHICNEFFYFRNFFLYFAYPCKYDTRKKNANFFDSFHLHRDLSHNLLTTIGRKIFKGATSLRSLQIDNNEITCLDEQAFKGLAELEIL